MTLQVYDKIYKEIKLKVYNKSLVELNDNI